MKKKILILLCISILSCIAIILCIVIISNKNKSNNSNNSDVIIRDINLKSVDDLIIGSEPPKILYADKEKVIFNCSGVYVYDIKNKRLSHTFNISTSASKIHRKWNCFVSEDGKQILFNLGNDNINSFVRYCYNFESDLVEEIGEQEYIDYQKKSFESTYLNYDDEMYEKTSGMIANISANEYVYLTFQGWLLSTIEIVYVIDGIETHYRVFNK